MKTVISRNPNPESRIPAPSQAVDCALYITVVPLLACHHKIDSRTRPPRTLPVESYIVLEDDPVVGLGCTITRISETILRVTVNKVPLHEWFPSMVHGDKRTA